MRRSKETGEPGVVAKSTPSIAVVVTVSRWIAICAGPAGPGAAYGPTLRASFASHGWQVAFGPCAGASATMEPVKLPPAAESLVSQVHSRCQWPAPGYSTS